MIRRLVVALLLLASVGCSSAEDLVVGAPGSTAAPASPAEASEVRATPTCEQIERFAESVVDVGITYDHQGTWSPAELATDAAAVIAGRLTGTVTERRLPQRGESSQRTFAAYEIEVGEDLAAEPRWVAGATVEALVEHNPGHHDDVDELRRATTAGTPVVLLAHEDPDTGELIASIEGFITSCEDGPLLGWTGSLGRWSTLATLDDLIAELRSPEPIGSCGNEAGAPTDLSVEPSHWLAHGTYLRWQDVAGCDVRVDVIAHRLGSDHCEWEDVEFIVIGDPLGASIGGEHATSATRTYVWDPTDALGTDDRADRRTSLRVEDLPPTATDTGYRQGTAQLWLDPADRDHLYRVDAGWANRFLLDGEQTLLCL